MQLKPQPRASRLLRRARDERGATLVEFALVSTMLLLLVMGIIEFGRVLNTYIIVTNGAREGARLAALGRPTGEIRTRVLASVPGLTGSLVSVTTTNAQGTPGSQVTVRVDYPVTLVVPIIANLMPANPLPVTSSVVMRLE
jgi:Flp pilus assembly protein TadG